MRPSLKALEERIGYEFRDQSFLVRALTHRSWSSEQGSAAGDRADNEQFEFLGDSILGFIISESLVIRHPSASEGQLSQWKAHLVSSQHLHRCAVVLRLGDYLLLGKGEEQNGGRERKTTLADAVEALIAAMHLDGGIEVARVFVEAHILSRLENPNNIKAVELLNHKSVLQERTQALGLPVPHYSLVGSTGPEHAKIFTMEVRVGDKLASQASGPSKKAASQLAAERLIEELDAAELPDPAPEVDSKAAR